MSTTSPGVTSANHTDKLARKGKHGTITCLVALAALTWSALILLVGTASGFAFSVDQPIIVDAESVAIEAAFSYTVHGLNVGFEDHSEGVLVAWAWSFGDDSGKVSSEKNPSHEYMTPGKYTVTLRITDASGIQDQVSETIRLGSLDTKTISTGAGVALFVVGFVFVFRGDGELVRFAGVLLFVVGAAFFLSILTQRDLCGRIYDLLSNLWR